VLSVVPEVSWLTAAVETGELADAKVEYEHKWCEELETFLAGISFDGVSYRKELRSGVPHEQIVAAAKEYQADLIAMGATGRTGLVRVLLGSTTRRVLHDLPCSLLIVKQEDVIEQLLEDDLQSIALLLAEGQALYERRDYESAAVRFRQALARNPFHLQSVERLVDTYQRLGNDQEASKYRRRAELLRKQS
jgi:universal stress protein E